MKTKEYKNKWITLFFRCYNASKAILCADSMILNNIDRPSAEKRVNLHYWDSCLEIGGSYRYNLGDNLSSIIVDFLLKRKGLTLDTSITSRKHLYAVGSIISMGYQNATIWGSGFLEPLSKIRMIFHRKPFKKLDIRAVRGPKTRKVLIDLGYDCPEVYGDPGMLLPIFYPRPSVEKTNDYLIIPHFSKEAEYRYKYGNNHIGSMITTDYEKLVNQICKSKLVISGSLHGIIIAEAYGVPTIFLRDRAANKDFKYIDYYTSTRRTDFTYALSIERALTMKPMPLPINLKELQDGLIRSFPYDLWK